MALCFPLFSYGQRLIDDDTFEDENGITFKVGDDLMTGEPAASASQFKFIQNTTKKKIGWMSKMASSVSSVGKSVAEVGSDVKSGSTVSKGASVANTANSTNNLANSSEKLLVKEEDIANQSLRILKFRKTGNEKRGEHFFAVVAGPGKANYEVELVPAIKNGEVVGLNDKLFDTK
ncbi:hypothetical protein GCM10023231_21960 [Olivibacter ginsenosidimutans]|uniref:Uncharacterized protein n=2 Tax=Olivibacter ginsenosidimutans TaxID=1176537 RepID=A0ABP9BC01_9SPHI